MKRKGSTLIELALTLPIFTALLVLAIGGVHQVMQVSRLAKDRGQLAYVFARLEQSIRSDVHEAYFAKVERDEKTNRLSLHLSLPDDSRIVYRPGSNRIDRERMDATGRTRTNSFALFLENKVLCEIQENRTVLMSIHRMHRDHTSADRLELFVRANLGRPHLQVPTQKGKKDE